MLKDGIVDLKKFEIKINSNQVIYKLIRDTNEKPSERKRPSYSGPEEAIFYECENLFKLPNQRFLEDFQIGQKLNFIFSPFL